MKDIRKELLDELLEDYEKPEDLLGEEGLLKSLQKALMERAFGPAPDLHHQCHREPARSLRKAIKTRGGQQAAILSHQEHRKGMESRPQGMAAGTQPV